MANTVTPEQRFEFGKRLAERLGAIDADKDRVQMAIESYSHPFWFEVEKHFSQKSQIIVASDQEVFSLWMSKQTEFWKQFGITPLLDGLMDRPDMAKAPIGEFCLPIYNPGTMDDQQLADTVLKRFRPHWVSAKLVDYSGADASGKPSFVLVRNTIEPDKIHLGKSADDARAYAKEHNAYFLDRQHYIILFAFHVFMTGKNLDVKGWTRFPEIRLLSGCSANGFWFEALGKVRFSADNSGDRCDCAGPREGKFFSL